MSKPRSLQEVQQDYNQKLHSLGNLSWQLEHQIPAQIEKVKFALKGIEKEAELLAKVESAKKQVAPKAPEAEQPAAQP